MEVADAAPPPAMPPAAPATPPVRPPRPWLALLLSLLQPGLGHLYVWRPALALAAWAASFLAGAVAIWIVVQVPSVPTLALAILLVLGAYLGVAWHAWRTARLTPGRWRPRRLVLALALAAWGWIMSRPSAAIVDWTRRNVVRAFRIPSDSMEPGVLRGDFVFVRQRHGAPLQRDRLATYHNNGRDMLKRIAGLAGDTLEMRAGRLYRNGRAVDEPYARTGSRTPATSGEDFRWQRRILAPGRDTTTYRPTVDAWGPLVVPAGTVFLLGDNRHESLDSRYVGPVAADSVFGYPTSVYFSKRPSGRIRWERIGLRLDKR